MTECQPPDNPTFPNEVRTGRELLTFIQSESRFQKTFVAHLFWQGCRNACHLESNLEELIREFVELHDDRVARVDIPWRLGCKTDEDTFYDYRTLATPSYQLFREMVICKPQQLGGFNLIDSYSVPPWDRPHFPQLILIDGASVDASALQAVIDADTADKLFNSANELILSNEVKQGDEYHQDRTLQHNIRRIFPAKAVLLQLVNQHLYPRNDDDANLQKEAVLQSLNCVIDGSGPRNCFSYRRGPIISGCGTFGDEP